MRTPILLAALCCLAVSLATAADLLPNGDFEAGLEGWQTRAETGAVVALAKDKPAAGKGCLLLQSTPKQPAWVLSPELPSASPGQVLQVTFQARRSQGQSALLLDLVSALSEVGDSGIWEAQLPADANWHKVTLLIKTPPVGGEGKARLAFGAVGGAGSWQLDDIKTGPGTIPAMAVPDQSGEKPLTGRVADDWAPEGLLDATSKQIGDEEDLIVNVNGVELGVRREFVCYRGFREAMVVYASNRAILDKTVRVQVTAPGFIDSPAWDVPVRKAGTTTFRMAVQSLRQGEYWIKLTFTGGGQSASLPVKLICKPSYPALGVGWRSEVDPAALRAALQVPLDMQLLVAPPDPSAFEPMVAAVRAAGTQFIAAPSAEGLSGPQYTAAVTSLLDGLQPTFWLPYCGSDPGAAMLAAPGLVSALRKKQLPTGLLSPPLELVRDWTRNSLQPAKPGLLTADRVGGLVALTCRLPRLRPACVVGEQIDDRGDVPGGAAAAQWRQSDLSGMRALLGERRLNLPMLVEGLQSAPGGDDRLEALGAAKALVNCLSQGSTGVTIAPQATPANTLSALPAGDAGAGPRPLDAVLRVVQDELASATPLMPLLNTPEASVGPSTPVSYRLFLRGGEGIAVLWNNTSTPKDITLEFRSEPVVSRRVVLSYTGDFATARWEPLMKFPEEAYRRGIPSLYLRLEPLQVQFHSFRLLDPHAAWLRGIALTKPWTPPTAPPSADRRDDRTWWTDMLKGRRTTDQSR